MWINLRNVLLGEFLLVHPVYMIKKTVLEPYIEDLRIEGLCKKRKTVKNTEGYEKYCFKVLCTGIKISVILP